ncbi:MAG TPA: anthranilate 1,2-dioxygenase small subunit AndAd [Stellaceae bacterium]|nr:anthranilate 1,2-dioxygenase small subunit AndAd [Stellaceae bacterium]
MDKLLMLRLELAALQDRYISVLDNDRLEEWPTLFVEDCLYEIIPKENYDRGLPAPVIHCDNRRMMEDRVLSLRNANIFAEHTYRHMVSGLELLDVTDGAAGMTSNYLVISTNNEGTSTIYQAGRYIDRVVLTPDGWRYKSKRVVYDTLRVATLLATPI